MPVQGSVYKRNLKMCELFAKGWKVAAIAEYYDLHYATVYQILHRQGFTRGQKATYFEERRKRMLRAYMNGASIAGLARENDISTQRVRQVLGL